MDDELLKRFHPEWYQPFWNELFSTGFTFRNSRRVGLVAEQLILGDRSPALVVSINPDIVAAYSEELDCVAMLRFPEMTVPRRFAQVGCRLTTINFDYTSKRGIAADLTSGSKYRGRWQNFLPLIGEFLSADSNRLAELQETIPDSWWGRVDAMASTYDFRKGIRDGRPLFAAQPNCDEQVWKMEKRGY